MKRMRHLALALAMIVSGMGASGRAEATPVLPCTQGAAVVPGYASVAQAPAVAVWRDQVLAFGPGCPAALTGQADLVVAVSRAFRHGGTVEDLARRVGAISALDGLQYWSTTDGAWRELISQSQALSGPRMEETRGDYSARDVMGGGTLFMTQRDTRSSGGNLYVLTGAVQGQDQLWVSTVNLTAIRFLAATVFPPETLVSTHVFTRLEGDVWGYYGLIVVKPRGRTRGVSSFINRAAAFERFLTGRSPTAEPPLAP